MDSRLVLRDMTIDLLNGQKQQKSKISISFEELEEKVSTLTLEIPNPFANREEMFSYINSRVNRMNEAIREHNSLRPPPVTTTKTKKKSTKGFPTKKDPLDEFE